MKGKGGKKCWIAAGCLSGLAGALATIGETWYLGQIVGALEDGNRGIREYLVIVLAMVVLEYLANTVGSRIRQMTQRRIVMDLRQRMFEKSVHMDYQRLKERDSGDLNSLYLSDTDIMGGYYRTLMDSFGQIAGGAAALLICVRISWKFLLISLLVLPVMLLAGELADRKLKRYARAVQQKKGAAAAVLLDAIRNKNMAVSYSAQEYMIGRFTEAAEAENRAVMEEAGKRGIASGVSRISGSLPFLAIFVVGGLLIFRGEIRIGEFFTFACLFSNVQSLQMILELRMAKKGCEAARERLDEFFLQPDAERGKRYAGPPEGDRNAEGFRLCDVSFSYGNGQDIFRGVSLCMEKGDSVGFVGESGAGKSTLLGLLTGLYAPGEGAVRYCCRDGCYEGSACRDRMAVVFQDNYLFPTTIRENLLMGRPEASGEELLLACRDAGILEDIEKMPEGLDTRVSELGSSLSGGQRQRICIARALVRKPEILILDEPSASLDTVHEMQLMERLSDVMKDGILIVVSHRESTIGKLKTVYSLENGILRPRDFREAFQEL